MLGARSMGLWRVGAGRVVCLYGVKVFVGAGAPLGSDGVHSCATWSVSRALVALSGGLLWGVLFICVPFFCFFEGDLFDVIGDMGEILVDDLGFLLEIPAPRAGKGWFGGVFLIA